MQGDDIDEHHFDGRDDSVVDSDERFLADIAAFLEAHDSLPLPALACGSTDAIVDTLESHDPHEYENDDAVATYDRTHSPAPSPPPAPPAGPPTKTRNVSRERMQHELKQLRVQASDLTRQLEKLRGQPPVARHTPASGSMLIAYWESTAKRQLALRVRSELENASMKKRARLNADLAEALQTAIARSSACGGSVLPVPPAPPTAANINVTADDAAVCKQLVSELDNAYARLDCALTQSGVRARVRHRPPDDVGASSLLYHTSVKTRSSDPTTTTAAAATSEPSLYLELTSSETLPFARDAVFRSLWDCWATYSAVKGYKTLEHTPFTSIACGIDTEVPLGDDRSVTMHLVYAARAYRECERISFVWRAVTTAAADFPGVTIDETGWQTLTSVSGDDSSTEILTCVHIESKTQSERSSTPQVSPLANIVMSVVDADELEVSAMMRRVLLEDAADECSRGRDNVVCEARV